MAVLAVALQAAACSDTAGPPPPPAPAVHQPNALQHAVAGDPFAYDATQGGATFADTAALLAYEITFRSDPLGLVAVGGRLLGTPTSHGTVSVRITARDALQRTAQDTFSVVVARRLSEPQLPQVPFRYAGLPLPRHFEVPGPGGIASTMDNTPAGNAITDAGATLGRVLFYDRRLSANHTVSCASCHRQEHGFSDPERLSRGLHGDRTERRSMALANARFYERGRFFWDERGETLEDAVLLPIQDPVEMGMDLAALTTRLAATSFYAPLFTAAFGSPEITPQRIGRALAQFVRSLISTGSRFDAAFDVNGQLMRDRLTPQELQGFETFAGTAGNCALCHNTNAQVTREPFNIGMDVRTTDAGADEGRFKVPSLRNVAIRGPYMHAGQFTTLEEVIEHYDSGVLPHPALAVQLRDMTHLAVVPRRLNLTDEQKAALIAFLRTLTDEAFLSDPRFADPFIDR